MWASHFPGRFALANEGWTLGAEGRRWGCGLQARSPRLYTRQSRALFWIMNASKSPSGERFIFFSRERRAARVSHRRARTLPPLRSRKGSVPAPKAEPLPDPVKASSSSDLKVQTALQCLHERFGFRAFRPGQLEVILRVMDRRSALAIFPTGAGKSLCFQIPAVLSNGLTLVVSPLIALMRDQVEQLRARGIPATHIHSDMSAEEVRDAYRELHGNAMHILFVAPERFTNEKFRQHLSRLRVELFVIDEAHCLSEWGHSFRPEYLLLSRFAKECGARACLALTATATARVTDDICRHFCIQMEDVIRAGVYRPNLALRCTPIGIEFGSWRADADDRERFERRVAILAKRILSRPRGSTVVYVTLQRTAAAVAERLSSKYGLPAVAYHAGMSSEHREWSQDRFMTGQDEIIVATIAFGMGVDKREIRYVYHFNMSKSIETYTQGIGRAGRDGEPAICESFLCSEDIPLLESFVLSDTPSKTAIDSFLEAIFGTKNTFTTSARGPRERIRESIGPNSLGKLSGESHDIALSLYDLSRDLDVKDTTLRVMLALLDLRYGYIQEQTAFFGRCEFDLLPGKNIEDTLQMLVAERTVSDYILRAARLLLDSLSKPGYRRNAERNMFLRIDTHEAVLTLSEKFSMPHQSSAAMHDLFFATVELLQASGVVSSVRFSKLYNVFRILRQPEDIWRVAEELHRLMIERERRELHRIRAVMALFLGTENRPIGEMAPGHGSQCLARTLCAHYNEILVHRCGICEGCLAEQGALAETMALRSLRHYSLRGSVGSYSNSAVEEDECWQRMVMELPDLLADPTLIARFAWGITSPKISMMKLKTHPLFGALQGRYSYGEILEVAEKHKTEGPS